MKRVVGEDVVVHATIFRAGHDVLGGALRYRGPGARRWREAPLEPLGNDRWHGTFTADKPGRWTYTVAAWVDRIASWQDEVTRKVEGGQKDLEGELSEGRALVGTDLSLEEALAAPAGDRHDETELETKFAVDVDPPLARFSAWYELFPRSWGGFAGVEKVLPELAELGFDVVYLPPIHPIGRTNRKGRNNAVRAKRGRRRQPVGDRRRGGRARRDPSRPRHARRVRAPREPRARSSASRSRSTTRSSARPITRG